MIKRNVIFFTCWPKSVDKMRTVYVTHFSNSESLSSYVVESFSLICILILLQKPYFWLNSIKDLRLLDIISELPILKYPMLVVNMNLIH